MCNSLIIYKFYMTTTITTSTTKPIIITQYNENSSNQLKRAIALIIQNTLDPMMVAKILPTTNINFEDVRDYCLDTLNDDTYNDDSDKKLYLGWYYYGEHDDFAMKTFYEMAVRKGNVYAMFYLAVYYDNINVNHCYEEQLQKYYKMAINKGHIESMLFFGDHFWNRYIDENNNNQVCSSIVKYYRAAADKGSIKGMVNLGTYYKYIDINPEQMKVFYDMALNSGNFYPHFCDIDTLYDLAIYCRDVKKNYDTMLKFLQICLEKDNDNKDVLYVLAHHYGHCDDPKYRDTTLMIQIIIKLLGKNEHDIFASYLLAQYHFQNNNTHKALEICNTIMCCTRTDDSMCQYNKDIISMIRCDIVNYINALDERQIIYMKNDEGEKGEDVDEGIDKGIDKDVDEYVDKDNDGTISSNFDKNIIDDVILDVDNTNVQNDVQDDRSFCGVIVGIFLFISLGIGMARLISMLLHFIFKYLSDDYAEFILL